MNFADRLDRARYAIEIQWHVYGRPSSRRKSDACQTTHLYELIWRMCPTIDGLF